MSKGRPAAAEKAANSRNAKSPAKSPSKSPVARSLAGSKKRNASAAQVPAKATKAADKNTTKSAAGKKKAAPEKPAAAKKPAKERVPKSAGRRSKSAAPTGRSAAASSSAQRDSDSIIYKEGAFVCFVNGGDKEDDERWDRFCLGQVSILNSTFS